MKQTQVGMGERKSGKSSSWDKALLFTAQAGWKETVYVDSLIVKTGIVCLDNYTKLVMQTSKAMATSVLVLMQSLAT